MKNFPTVECFQLTEDILNCNILEKLILENKENVLCFYISTEHFDSDGWHIVSTNKYHELIENRPNLRTKYFDTFLCIWKPEISRVHAFYDINLRWCFEDDRTEGNLVLQTLSENSPYALLIEGAKINVDDLEETSDLIQDLSNYVMAGSRFQKGDVDGPVPRYV